MARRDRRRRRLSTPITAQYENLYNNVIINRNTVTGGLKTLVLSYRNIQAGDTLHLHFEITGTLSTPLDPDASITPLPYTWDTDYTVTADDIASGKLSSLSIRITWHGLTPPVENHHWKPNPPLPLYVHQRWNMRSELLAYLLILADKQAGIAA